MSARRGPPRGDVLSLPAEARSRRSARAARIGAWLVTSIAATGLVGCGGGTGDAIVARVGASTISEATLDRWMAQLAPEHVVPDPPHYSRCVRHEEAVTLLSLKAELMRECRRQYRALRLQALNGLISSRWLVGEAQKKGLMQAADKVAFQAKTELARESIRHALFSREAHITRAQVAHRYRREIAHYRISERRYFEIFEHIRSEAAARKVRAQLADGQRNVAAVHLQESLERPASFDVGDTKGSITIAIFTATPRVLSDPVPLDGQYALFELTKVMPSRTRPLAQVAKSIGSRLAHEQRRRTLARFIAGWRTRWRAKTYCAARYVVQKCRQYSGPLSAEDPLALR